MTGRWKPWKTKLRFPTVPTVPWKSHKPRFPHFHNAGDGSLSLPTKQPRCALRALAQQLIKELPQNRTLCRASPRSGSSRTGINFPFRAHSALESLLTFRLICGLENALSAKCQGPVLMLREPETDLATGAPFASARWKLRTAFAYLYIQAFNFLIERRKRNAQQFGCIRLAIARFVQYL